MATNRSDERFSLRTSGVYRVETMTKKEYDDFVEKYGYSPYDRPNRWTVRSIDPTPQ